MRQMLRIAAKDLKQRVRDRSVFIVGIIAPAMLALIFTFAFGDVLDPSGGGFEATYGFVDLDGGDAAAGLAAVLDGIEGDQFSIESYATVAEVEVAIDDDELSAAFIVPEDFSESIGSGTAVLEVVGNVDTPVGAGIAAAIAEGYADAVDRVTLTVAGSLAAGADPRALDQVIATASNIEPLASIGAITTGVKQMDGSTYLMAGMAVFFLFFTVQFGVASLLEEKRVGTWGRLLAAPVTRAQAIGAKVLVSFLLGVVSMAVLMVGATIGLGADWGDPLSVSVLVILGVLAATGVMALVSAIAKTVEAAGNIQSIIAVALGMLGGTFVQISQDGGLLSRLSLITPHHWFIQGLNDLGGGGAIGDIVPSIVGIGGFAVVTGGLAVWAFSRTEAV
ncbi:MAG: ABC transporter permease [Acidimicrobiia bacterium]|nr:ABC transporter permease [Acidimicrobiia bacterium]